MCGIFGYIGNRNAVEIGLDGIKELEYRGYDSSGVVFCARNGIERIRAVGKIIELEKKIFQDHPVSGVALYHSRWATHGGVTEANAHPHIDCSGEIAVVHNGIIENYQEIKSELVAKGHLFRSETDTEVIPHIIEEELKNKAVSFERCVQSALQKIKGTYGIGVMHARYPAMLIAARNFSPLLLGIGNAEYFLASDASAILRHTRNVVYLHDGDIAVMTPSGYRISDLGNRAMRRMPQTLEWSAEHAQRGDFPHFMLKEIFEEPEAVENSIRGRIVPEFGTAKLGGLESGIDDLRAAKRIIIAACGTAHLAGKIGRYMIEEYAGIPAYAEIASEFRYRKPVFQNGDVFFAISQSGETADTLAALREAKEKGASVYGIVNSIGSTIAREAGRGIYQHVGPEISVASTKAFVSQVAIMALLAIMLGRSRMMSAETGARIGNELKLIPDKIRSILGQSAAIRAIAEKYADTRNVLYLGRTYNSAVAEEGALKLKEISYIHAEGLSAGEIKHGPLAIVDTNVPSVAIIPEDGVYRKMLSNIQELRARGGPVIAITTEGNREVASVADDVVYIPETLEMLTPLLSVIPLQLFAYHMAVVRGLDVDKPRNLAKSVTVE